MGNGPTFETQRDYELPLLRLLYKLRGRQGKAAEVRHQFEREYGDRIPHKHRDTYRGRELVWENNVNWCRNYLKERGFLDMPKVGIWRITDDGRRWVEENPDADRLPPFTYKKREGTQGSSRTRRGARKTKQPDITLAMLEETRKVMPAEQFRQIWGDLYDQLLVEERAKAITQVTQTELGRRARRRLDEIHAFLLGDTSDTPTSDKLCDWIHFCYAFDLYREAAALLPYIREDEVEPIVYKRTKRVAEVSRTRLG